MNVLNKELDKSLIEQANNNSFGGKRGNIEAHEYEVYCEKVIAWNLSERKTQKILDKVYDYFSKALSLGAQHVSVMVAGGSNYNAKRLDKSDKILSAASDFVEWFKEVESQATAKQYDRKEWLVKEIALCVLYGLPVTKEWKELAGRDRDKFNELYETLDKKYKFKKPSLPYKIYNNLISVEKTEQEILYSDGDLCAYRENDKICISFRMKPQRQMIVALKSRKFVWISAWQIWRGNATEENAEWVKTISEKYEDYI